MESAGRIFGLTHDRSAGYGIIADKLDLSHAGVKKILLSGGLGQLTGLIVR